MSLQEENLSLLIWSDFSWTWNREQRTGQAAVKCTIWDRSADMSGFFSGLFFSWCSSSYIFFLEDSAIWTCRAHVTSYIKWSRFFYKSGINSLVVSQRYWYKAEQQLGNVTGWRQRSLCPPSASKKSSLKVYLKQNINLQSILRCEESHYRIHDEDQLKTLKDKIHLALQFKPLVTSAAGRNCNWWVTLSPI